MAEHSTPPVEEFHLYPQPPELLDTPLAFYKDLTASISKAHEHIDLAFFTFEHDAITQPIFQAIHTALQRENMTVRIFYDHLGVSPLAMVQTARVIRQLKKDAKGKLLTQSAKNIFGKGGLGNLINSLHKKIAVIDAENPQASAAYIGGVNISGRHTHFSDLMVKLPHPDAVAFVANDFERTWNHQNAQSRREPIDEQTIMHALGKGKEGNQTFVDTIVSSISAAFPGQPVWLETAYLDKGPIRQALIAAKKRGADVKIITAHPQTTNDISYRWSPQTTAQPFVKSGVPLYLYHGKESRKPNFSHTKIFIIGQRAFVGSFNHTTDWVTGRNEEIVMETTNPTFVGQLTNRFELDRTHSVPYDEAKQQQPTRRRKRW